MDDDRIRHVAREGLRPMLGETPAGPSWEELDGRRPKRQAWLAGGVTALIVLAGVAALPLLIGQQPGATTTAPVQGSTTTEPATTAVPTTTSTTSTTGEPGTGLPLETPVPLQVLSTSTSFDALVLLDLQLGTMTSPEGVLAVVAGAVYNGQRELILWSNEMVQVFGPGVVEAENEFAPSQPPPTSSMWVVPARDGDTAWIVQPGADNGPTFLELRNIESAERLIVAETDAGLTPVGTTDDGLVFNTSDGQVVLFTYSGATLLLGNGRAIATNDTAAIRLACNGDLPADCEDLWVTRTDRSDDTQIVKPDAGIWVAFANGNLPAVSPDGTKLLIGFGLPTTHVHVVDLVDGGVQPIAPVVGEAPMIAWSSDGNWIALIDGTDIDLINANDPAQVITLRGVIPESFRPIAAG
jgi:hypothetical protein